MLTCFRSLIYVTLDISEYSIHVHHLNISAHKGNHLHLRMSLLNNLRGKRNKLKKAAHQHDDQVASRRDTWPAPENISITKMKGYKQPVHWAEGFPVVYNLFPLGQFDMLHHVFKLTLRNLALDAKKAYAHKGNFTLKD
eukprot:1160302-Pelagomonas_calceolata.AAC.9